MSATLTNGKPQRKQLADQIDRFESQLGDQCARLDRIIDTLAEGLPAAVAEACREGARAAVRDAVIELLTNPELRELLTRLPATPTVPAPPAPSAAPAPEPRPKRPGLWDRVKARVAAARAAASGAVTRVKEALIRRCVIAGDAVVALGHATGETLPVRQVVLVGLGVGAAVGLACLLAPQTVAAAVGAAGAAGTAVSVQVGTWLTRAARRVGLLN